MKFASVFGCLTAAALVGCSTLPTAGPSANQVVDQSVQNGRQRFDLVDVSEHVVSALLAQPTQSFRAQFRGYGRAA